MQMNQRIARMLMEQAAPQQMQDQNHPLLPQWGLPDVIARRSDTMQDPGRFGEEYGEQQRQKTEDYEINVLRRLFGRGLGGEI